MSDPGQGVKFEAIENLLRQVPFFRALARVDFARLIGALEEVHFPADTLVFAEGAEADALYLLERGRIAITVATADGERSVAVLEAPSHFGDLGLLLARRTGSAHALTDVHAWRLPRSRFEQLVGERPAISLSVAASLAQLIDERSRQHVGAPVAAQTRRPVLFEPRRTGRSRAQRIVALGIALGGPLALWAVPPPSGLNGQGWHVSLIMLGAALAWLMEPVPDFVVALAMPAAWAITGLVPLSHTFAGFTSPSYLVALGALGLAAAMARSGLLFRITLRLLKTFPATYSGQVLALTAGGLLVTPLMPLAIARVAAIAPLTQELSQALGLPPRSRGSAGVSFAGILGHGAFSSIFLTGLAMNFFVSDLLPAQDHTRFDWMAWLIRAAPAGAVILAGVLLILLVMFRPKSTPKTTTEALRLQERALGPLSQHEAVTIAALAVLLLGLLLQPLLRVDGAWLAICALILVTAGGTLDRDAFRSSIEWGFLMLFGILLGTSAVLRSVGVDKWIGDAVVPLARTVGDPGVLAVLLGASVAACRLVLPWIPATLLLSLALVPAASQLGLPPWIVGFVILVAANTWLHPRQSDFYRLARDTTRGEMFTDRDGLIVGVAVTLLTLIAIAVSIPYWRAIGLLAS